jgi:excisionase family DNA binding protein
MSALDQVLTTQEAAKILNLNDSTIRRNVINGKYDKTKYRKKEKVILFDKKYIQSLVKK